MSQREISSVQDVRLAGDVPAASLGMLGDAGIATPLVGNDYWRDDDQGPGPRIMAASTLEGDDVKNDQDETLGEIKEIMIDVPTGRVAYAVMSVGGVLGIGNRLFAIPWKALRLDPENKCFRMTAAKEKFDDAPGFDKDSWPTMADESWARDVHTYYGARPYWE